LIYKSLFICLFFSSYLLGALSPRLLIKFPTRSRPEQFISVLDKYYKNLSNNYPYTFVITCDADDKTMNNKAMREQLKTYPNLIVRYGNSRTKVEACNADVDLPFDILLLASDDMIPVAKNYDQIIIEDMLKFFPDFDGVLSYNDKYVGEALNTYPVMGSKYYQRFGYIYHPIYKSLCCDNEFTLVSKMLGKEKYIDTILLHHAHPYWHDCKQDALYKKNNRSHRRDKRIFFSRKALNFDL